MAKQQDSLAIQDVLDPVRKTVRRMSASRNYPAGVTGVDGKAAADEHPARDDALHATGLRPLSRPFALWILILAFWVSIGMIVSAAAVTVTFLA